DFHVTGVQTCALPISDLATVPSAAEDGTVAPRPWIERTAGRTNLPDGVSIAQALQCFAPVGNDGCDFQSPLEAMSLAFIRSTNRSEERRVGKECRARW